LRRRRVRQQRAELVDCAEESIVEVDDVPTRLRAATYAEYQASMVGGETHHVQLLHVA
jgi:hypothetical protein